MDSHKGTHLDGILARTRTDVAARKAGADMRALERLAAAHTPRGFAGALVAKAKNGTAIIAELKKASPSKGVIRAEFDAAALAASLEEAGAAALSVLTDAPFFQGSLGNLQRASAATKLPCLRKDFMVDEFQMLEARANCADAVLLIAAALSDAELQRLHAAAKKFSLDVLCEVHNREELDRVASLGCDAYGVNNRNLKTFEVSLDTAISLADRLPANAVRVAESGIHSAEDLQRLCAAGYQAFLIGETLMRQSSPAAALRGLLDEVSSSFTDPEMPAAIL
jgi:indole-3-glycerol phosphate synthase